MLSHGSNLAMKECSIWGKSGEEEIFAIALQLSRRDNMFQKDAQNKIVLNYMKEGEKGSG